jgi:hypothetical protein
MSKRINFIGIVFFLLLHLFAGEVVAQNRIDSIQAEVKALKESYEEKMTALYYEMLEITQNEEIPVWEQNRAKTLFHIFSNEESVTHMIENIHVHWFQQENGESAKKKPYFNSLIRVINKNGKENPAIMKKLLISLDKPVDTYEQYFNYSLLFVNFFGNNVSRSLSYDEMAACVRILANSNIKNTIRRQNLLKIAEILEKR